MGLMFQELIQQDMVNIQAWVQFFDEERDLRTSYVAIENPRTSGIAWTSGELTEFNDQIAVLKYEQMLSATPSLTTERWRQGRVCSDTAVREWLDHRGRQIMDDFGLDRVLPFYDQDMVQVTYIPFGQGMVQVLGHELADGQVAIIQQLTEALSLGYTRFLDFQQLEQQAEQARQERAVERIRAEAMAMRSSDDLMKVIAAILQEFWNLGVDTEICIINLVDVKRRLVWAYNASVNPRKRGVNWTSDELVEINESVAA